MHIFLKLNQKRGDRNCHDYEKHSKVRKIGEDGAE
jgi:hypothetical protein